MEELRVLAISGSLRKDSYNSILLQCLKKIANVPIDIFPLQELPIFNEDLETTETLPEAVSQFRKEVLSHSGLLIATPEYNWSIASATKNAIDWLSTNKDNFITNKCMAISGASTGQFGTVRAQLHLRLILTHLGANLMNSPELYISRAQDIFDQNGDITDDKVYVRMEKFIETFIEWCTK